MFNVTHFSKEPHGGDENKKILRRLHAYAHVADLRFLPISTAENLWVLCAAMERTGDDTFDEEYLNVLRIRALECLEVYEFDE